MFINIKPEYGDGYFVEKKFPLSSTCDFHNLICKFLE